MKKVILLLAMSSLLSTLLLAQTNPEGMNYQAVARNLKGEILVNQPIALKVKLFSLISSGKVEYFNEEHRVITSPTGVFSLIIGKGTALSGTYNNIPWSSTNVWMEVSIKNRGDLGYAVMSNSKLMAVPYAYHSVTADRLTGGSTSNVSTPGSPSNSWLLVGNNGTNVDRDKLGNTDSMDLKVVTNNTERMRVYGSGDINISKSARVANNLLVENNTELNKTGGATINNGAFTVTRQSPTLLSGILTVDGATDLNNALNVDGITDLNSRLNVNFKSATYLSGNLNVKGVTDLDSAFNVNNARPSLLTGTLEVRLDALLKEKLKVTSLYQTDTSTSTTPSGALQVSGGAYIGKNLYIGGIAKFGGPAAFGGAVSINDLTQSDDPTTGALKVGGGVGIGRNLNVGGAGLITGSFGVAGISSVTNILQSTSTTNGAFVVAGGAGIGKNLYVGGALTASGITTLNNTLTVNASSTYIANFVNSTNANGISIQVQSGEPGTANNFVTFRNSSGGAVGRIEGETSVQLVSNDDYIVEKKSLDLAVSLSTIGVVTGGISVIMAGVDLVGAASSSTVCAGLGVCVTAPVPSLIIAAGVNLAAAIADEVSVAIGLDEAITQRNLFVSNALANVGVTYQSGSGDYAEWLPKANQSEKFKAGYIVGMKNGQISLNTEGSDKLFAISTKPIVLGNMPEEGKESTYEKVAFMGQIPVHVIGKVNAGDYILPSGFNNGFGKAIAPAKMKADDYANIVGMAWSTSLNEGYNLVNVAIGLNAGDISKVVAVQSKEISELKNQINEIKSMVANLAAGVKTPVEEIKTTTTSTPISTVNNTVKIDKHDFLQQDASTIVYFDITTEQTTAMLDQAEKLFMEKGGEVSKHPFWKRINSDASYKSAIMEQIKITFRKGMHTHQELNSKKSLQPTR